MFAGRDKLPYGNLPRLILAWVCSEAVRTQSRVLVLGKSLSEFMRTLGVYRSSGEKHTRLRNQMKRLFGCTVSMIYENERGEARVSSLVADRTVFWWSEGKPDQSSLWESKIELGEKFFQEIINHPVPLNLNTLAALKRSTLGLDLYLWLVYRTFPLRAPLRLTWPLLYSQFGAHPAKASDKRTVDNFRTKCLRELKKIKLGLAGVELHDGSGCLDPLAFDACHHAAQSRPTNKLGSPFRPLSGPSRPRRSGLDSPVSAPLKVAPGAARFIHRCQ